MISSVPLPRCCCRSNGKSRFPWSCRNRCFAVLQSSLSAAEACAEGITHGKTGFLCHTADEMAALVNRLDQIDRAFCRAEAVRRFSNEVIVGEYEKLYAEIVGR
jgi:glycosyltransferase involved in cell wall biosynthesis